MNIVWTTHGLNNREEINCVRLIFEERSKVREYEMMWYEEESRFVGDRSNHDFEGEKNSHQLT